MISRMGLFEGIAGTLSANTKSFKYDSANNHFVSIIVSTSEKCRDFSWGRLRMERVPEPRTHVSVPSGKGGIRFSAITPETVCHITRSGREIVQNRCLCNLETCFLS